MIQSMPNDERHRLPPSSSDLEALGVSPSPTFTSISFSPDSQISPSCTSGDIPIMFHLSSEDSIASLCQSAHRLNTATTLQPSASAQTVESVSTFGPHRHRNEGPVFEHRSSSYAARYSQICSLLGLEGDPDQSFGDTSVSSDQTNPSPSPSPCVMYIFTAFLKLTLSQISLQDLLLGQSTISRVQRSAFGIRCNARLTSTPVPDAQQVVDHCLPAPCS
ncbi:hypothetical protein BD626DRAFT_196028 [Schizophyllum amplum]|uniref:Uncharacterized protein n=1 Tax=Schizophyllum amplum TaxID=97359 RepID=A0A550CML4_9AGAR|nr:hypothetical protein BD626DRAFT_196028 [Auriculariopsis ampla]